MKLNGTLINYYFHCKRQCFLHANRINLESNSQDVKIGKTLHAIKNNSDNNEVKFDNIVIDKITSKYVIEYKKSDADVNASKMQLLYYLKVLKDKGIIREGKLIFLEKGNNKTEIIKLTEKEEAELTNCISEIEQLVNLDKPPKAIKNNKCKKCAYYEYCFL